MDEEAENVYNRNKTALHWKIFDFKEDVVLKKH